MDTLVTTDLKEALRYKNKILSGEGFVKDPSDTSVLFECHDSYVMKGFENFILSDKMALDNDTVYKVSRYWGNGEDSHNNEPTKRWYSYFS